MKYDPSKIEPKWQKEWEKKKLYQAKENSGKQKYYQLETFPYPSAAGLHIGHPKGYIAEDIHARFMRMNDKEVLYTMGWDAFGLPTENYAIEIGKSPKEVAKDNIENFKRQLKMFGFSYDWSREINTSEPDYYKWTQWLFLQLYKAGMAYQKLAKVNWCPKDQTVLANEQIVDGCCERCGTEIVQKEMKQWFFKITDYAERLLGDLKDLDWPEETIKRQEDWIGRSEGAKVKFELINIPGQPNGSHFVEVFTTRPDTLFGATFVVVSPELAKKWIDVGWKAGDEVKKYVQKSLSKKELARLEAAGEKTGVDIGIKAINPATKEEIPVWVADYVLGSYGTGAIMAVPAHDQRDYEFAKKFDLSIKAVIEPPLHINSYFGFKPVFAFRIPEGESIEEIQLKGVKSKIEKLKKGEACYIGYGKLINSNKFDGIDSERAKWEITKFVSGEKQIQYRLRDWSVSRQRYWGVPIPIIYCDKCGVLPVSEKDLPVKLPELKDYRPKGMPPLASSEKFINVKCPKCNGKAKRDSETLDTFVDSSWYYLRYTDAENNEVFASPEKLKYWLPIDLYVIGAEHVTAHLLYARFITKFLYDQGYLRFEEPFLKLRHQGMILGPDGRRMSKRWGNVINPDDVIGQYGADTTRIYEMFMGPFENGGPWNPKAIVGVYRFLARVCDLANKRSGNGKTDRVFHKAIKKVGEDIENLRFNTAVSELMKLLNEIEDKELSKEEVGTFLKLLSPFAPHLAEELWHQLGNKDSIHLEKWPVYDQESVKEEKVKLVIQVNGRARDVIEIPADLGENEVRELALASEKIKKHIAGKEVRKFIYVPNKIANIVV